MKIKALQPFSNGELAMEQYEVKEVTDTLGNELVAIGVAVEIKSAVPTPTVSDNGKVLTVQSGEAAWVKPSTYGVPLFIGDVGVSYNVWDANHTHATGAFTIGSGDVPPISEWTGANYRPLEMMVQDMEGVWVRIHETYREGQDPDKSFNELDENDGLGMGFEGTYYSTADDMRCVIRAEVQSIGGNNVTLHFERYGLE